MKEIASTDLTLIHAVARQLPTSRRWTQQQRQHWFNAMRSAVDLAIKVEPAAESGLSARK